MQRSTERDGAIARGEKYYFTGKPCKTGHIAMRQVSNWLCVECHTQILARHVENVGGKEAFTERERLRSLRQYAKDPSKRVAASIKSKAKRLLIEPDFEAKAARRRRAENPTPHRAASKRWAGKNPEKAKAILDRWKAANPERLRELRRAGVTNRRAKLAKVGGRFTANDIARLYDRQKGKCAADPTHTGPLEIDHILAIHNGGSNDPSNLQLLCRKCNRSKGARDAIEWAQSNGRLF